MKIITVKSCGECHHSYFERDGLRCQETGAHVADRESIHKDCPLAEMVGREEAMEILMQYAGEDAEWWFDEALDKLGYGKEGV